MQNVTPRTHRGIEPARLVTSNTGKNHMHGGPMRIRHSEQEEYHSQQRAFRRINPL